MAKNKSNKVGDLAKGTEAQAEVKKEKGRQDYSTAELVKTNAAAIDENGLLTVAPSDFNHRKHKPLKKEAFSSEAVYLRYQSLIAGQKSEFYATKSTELTGKADRLEKFGSEAARKAATKLQRAKKQMVTIRQQLIDSGMAEEEIDNLIKDM